MGKIMQEGTTALLLSPRLRNAASSSLKCEGKLVGLCLGQHSYIATSLSPAKGRRGDGKIAYDCSITQAEVISFDSSSENQDEKYSMKKDIIISYIVKTQ